MSLEDCAHCVKLSKKTLDEYFNQIKEGKKYGFDFNKCKKDKVNVLRGFVKKKKEEEPKDNTKPKKKNITDKNSKNNDNNNFRPRISRGPKNINQRNVTVNLDGFYDQRITKEKKELQQSKKEDELEKKNLYNQKSKDIIIKMKIKKYKELFALLDSDQDGVISEDKIQLTKVEENILKNIKPILEELTFFIFIFEY